MFTVKIKNRIPHADNKESTRLAHGQSTQRVARRRQARKRLIVIASTRYLGGYQFPPADTAAEVPTRFTKRKRGKEEEEMCATRLSNFKEKDMYLPKCKHRFM